MPVKKVIYAASVMREEEFSAIFAGSNNMPGQQAQKFNRLMVDGIEKNGVEIFVMSAPPITTRNCNRRVVALGKKRKGNTVYRYLPILNVKYLKNPFVVLSAFFHTLFATIGRKSAIVCDVLNVSVAMGAVAAGRLLGKRCIGIVTDVPELMVTGHTNKQVKYCYKIIRKCTDYVFLTEAMNERLNPKGKPYIIVEGVCSGTFGDDDKVPSDERVCFYAGLLDPEYGVKIMVDGFRKAKIPNTRLIICGKGPYEAELTQIAAEDPSVEYLGSLMNSEVVEMEKKATLLINPRPSSGEFTKFSFPSKNMEYMASGTPVLTTKLPGMPKEYDEYVYLLEEETADGVCKSLREIFAKTPEELHQKGSAAKEFVLQEKNNVKQAEKLLRLINNCR